MTRKTQAKLRSAVLRFSHRSRQNARSDTLAQGLWRSHARTLRLLHAARGAFSARPWDVHFVLQAQFGDDETWREAGIPLEAVMRRIDAAFDINEASRKPGQMERFDGLAWCAAAVAEAAVARKEDGVGSIPESGFARDSGFENGRPAVRSPPWMCGHLQVNPKPRSSGTLSQIVRGRSSCGDCSSDSGWHSPKLDERFIPLVRWPSTAAARTRRNSGMSSSNPS